MNQRRPTRNEDAEEGFKAAYTTVDGERTHALRELIHERGRRVNFAENSQQSLWRKYFETLLYCTDALFVH